MRIDRRSKLWRGRNGRLWRLAERLEDTAQAIRYAMKPYDLVFPRSNLIDLAIQLRDMQAEWLEALMGLEKHARGQWPHL